MTSLQSGEAWPPFPKKWGGFGPPGPTYYYAYALTAFYLYPANLDRFSLIKHTT